jgi:hypothetical protein
MSTSKNNSQTRCKRMYRHYGLAIILLEFPKSTAVHDTSDDIPHIKSLAKVGPDNAMKLGGGIQRVFGFRSGLYPTVRLHK